MAVSFATLIPLIDFAIPDEFNDVVECKTILFFVLPKVIHELVQVSHVRDCIFQHFKTPCLVFSSQGRMM